MQKQLVRLYDLQPDEGFESFLEAMETLEPLDEEQR